MSETRLSEGYVPPRSHNDCKNRKDTYDKARTLELALQNSQQIQVKLYSCLSVESPAPYEPPVCAAVSGLVSPKPTHRSCYFCGNTYHQRNVCPARDLYCRACGKQGHFSKVCKSSKRPASKPSHQPTAASLHPYSLSDTVVNAKVNNVSVSALIDSGSTNSFLNNSTASELSLSISKSAKRSISMATNSHNIETLGTVSVNLQISGHDYGIINLHIMNNLCCDLIVGHDLLGLHDKVVIKFGGKNPDLIIDNVSDSAFACKLTAAKTAPPQSFEHLSPEAKPITCKSRRFSPSDSQFIEKEIEQLLAEGIIEPSSSPWRAQVLVANSDHGQHRRRMAVDYSRTINKYTLLDAYPLPNINELAHKVAQFSVYSSYDLKSAYHQVPLCDTDKPFTAFEASGRLYQFTRIPFGVTNGVAAFQRFMDGVIDQEGAQGTFAYLDNITICGVDQGDHDAKVAKFEEIVAKYGLTLNQDKTIKSVTEIKMLGYLISKGQIKPDPDRMKPLINLPVPCDPASLKRSLGLFSYYSQWVSQYSDKIQPLTGPVTFPLSNEAINAFEAVKQCVSEACIVSPNDSDLFVLETDASGYALSASLNQNGKPVDTPKPI